MKSILYDVGAIAIVIIAAAQGVANASEKEDGSPKSTGSAANGQAPSRPSFDELWKKLAQYERAYFPFHIKEESTLRIGDGLTAAERARFPWGDGRKHGRLMEYAQKADRVWLRKETHSINDKPSDVHYESYSDGNQQVQLTLRDKAFLTPAQVHVEREPKRIARWQWAPPLMGVFPIVSYSSGGLITRTFQDKQDEIRLEWDADGARLAFDFGPGSIRIRHMLWLSREHDWHPVKLQRYLLGDTAQFIEEWSVTKFVEQDGQWRVSEGTIHYYDRQGIGSSKVMYSHDFKVLEAEWGRKLPEELFDYEIPPGAEIHDPQQPKAEEPPTATRSLTVNLVDMQGKPVAGASVMFRAQRVLREFDRVKANEDGMARSNKLPDENIVVQIEADGFRPAVWVVGRSSSEHKVILAPRTRGVALDESGSPLPRAWITSGPVSFRADGLPHPPTGADIRAPDYSDERGRFELRNSLTIRNLEAPVSLIALDPSLERMSIRFLSPRELDDQQTMILRQVCDIRGACLLEGVTEPLQLNASIIADNGQQIGSVPTKTSVTATGLRAEFRFRLPAGNYSLQSRQSSEKSGFTLPVKVTSGQRELDLGMTTVAASGTVSLKGKPALELEVRWRDGKSLSLEKLRGRVVVLDFWGTWCGPCIAEMPELMEIADQFRDLPVEWLAVHTPSDLDFAEFDRQLVEIKHRDWHDRALPFKMVFDVPLSDDERAGTTARRYGVVAWPTTIVIDQKGRVIGAVSMESLADTLHRLLKSGETD